MKAFQILRKIVSSDATAIAAFVLAMCALAYGYGVLSSQHHLFPYDLARKVVKAALGPSKPYLTWSLLRSDQQQRVIMQHPGEMSPGLTLISAFTKGNTHSVQIIDPSGKVIYSWSIDYQKLWPNPDYLPKDVRERKEQPVHGIALAENGDLVFNFTELGMMRLDPCGRPVWRLPWRTHHAVVEAEDGTFWAPYLINHRKPVPEIPNYKPPFDEFGILHVSADGKVLQSISIDRLLRDHGRSGLLYMATQDESRTTVTNDTLHLNDVEVFPNSMPEGVFHHGDIMVSLRNISTILVFDPKTLAIRYINTGSVLREHDPDFVDGDTISAFDNNNLMSEIFDNASGGENAKGQRSRITTISARTNEVIQRFEGGEGGPFFSDLMGNHQHLANGNLLITVSREGRAFEVSPTGRLVWEYYNIVAPGLLGIVDDAQRLPARFDEAFFKGLADECKSK